MSNADVIHRLKQMQETYDEAEIPPEGGYGNWYDGLPDDDYQCLIESWDLFPGVKDPGALWLKMSTSIQHHAQFAGREIPLMWNLMDAERIGYLKADFSKLGYENLDLSDLAPGSKVLKELYDTPVLMGVYTTKNGGRWAVLRQRLDGSDLGTAQEQIEGFERGETSKPEPGTKPGACICPNPEGGVFDEDCPVPGHGIPF